MRLAKASIVAGAAALIIWVIRQCRRRGQQDADKKVAGGGVTVKGWTGKVDTATGGA